MLGTVLILWEDRDIHLVLGDLSVLVAAPLVLGFGLGGGFGRMMSLIGIGVRFAETGERSLGVR